MNKMLIIMLLFLIKSQLFGQQVTETENLSFKAPRGLVKTFEKNNKRGDSEEKKNEKKFQLEALRGEKFSGSGVLRFFRYSDTTITLQPDNLEKKKLMFDEMATIDGGKMPGYSSTIEYHKGFKALVIKTEIDNYIRCSIYTVNKSYSKIFNATFVALKQDKIEVDKAVKDLISTIKFK